MVKSPSADEARSAGARKGGAAAAAGSATQEDAVRILRATDYGRFRRSLAGFDCRLCPLHAGRTRLVVDRGDPRAAILLIGEAPGAEEDRKGLAFVGRSGKLLDALLAEAGVDPSRDVLIANIVKCRPPGNRAPTREEAARCLPYLERQIELVGPRWVVLLGATSARHILGDRGRAPMKELVGRRFRDPRLGEAELLVTFHPAFILRNRTRRLEMVEHLRTLAVRGAGRRDGSAS